MRLNGIPWSGDQAKPSQPKTTSARHGISKAFDCLAPALAPVRAGNEGRETGASLYADGTTNQRRKSHLNRKILAANESLCLCIQSGNKPLPRPHCHLLCPSHYHNVDEGSGIVPEHQNASRAPLVCSKILILSAKLHLTVGEKTFAFPCLAVPWSL